MFYNDPKQIKHVIPAIFVQTDIGMGTPGIVAACTCAKCITDFRKLMAQGGKVIHRDMENYYRLLQKVGK